MSKQILFIGYHLPHNLHCKSLDENVSLTDADIVVFCPDIKNIYNKTENIEKTLPVYNVQNSISIKKNIEYWKTELLNYIQGNKTLIILLKEKYEFFINPGFWESKEKLSNYSLLPFKIETNIINSKGKKTFSKNEVVKKIHSHFKDEIEYEVYIANSFKENSIIESQNGEKIFGIHLKQKKCDILFLPYLPTNPDNFPNGKKYNTPQDYYSRQQLLCECIIDIDKNLKNSDSKTPLPQWIKIEEFKIKQENEFDKLIFEKELEISNLEIEKSNLLNEKNSYTILKDLLFETGKPLEIAVKRALEILGYTAENFDNGKLELDQVIISPEGHRYIGECEGKDNKAIDISKFRQLSDSIEEDFAREEVTEIAYGLLIGNPERLLPPNERTQDFTIKCKDGAKRKNIGLLLTSDLFYATQRILETNDETLKKEYRDAIFNGLGDIIKF